MSKTDKENKENKEKTDIINIANSRLDFTYCRTQYYRLYDSIIMYSSRINNYYQNYQNERENKTHETNTIYDTILNINNHDTSYSSKKAIDNKYNKLSAEEKEKEKEQFALDLLNSNNIIVKLEDSLKSFDNFIVNIKQDTTLYDNKFFDNIYNDAKTKIDIIKREIESEMNKLEDLDDSLVRNLLYREVCNIIKDNLIEVFKLDKLDRVALFRSGSMLLRRVGMAIPGIGILFIIYEIVSILWSLYERYRDYSNAREGFQIGKEFYSLYIYFNKLNENLAYVTTNPNIDNTIFVKKYNEKNECIIHRYTTTNILTLLSCFESYCSIYYKDVRIKLLFYADSNLYNNSIFLLNDVVKENVITKKYLDECVQLSLYNSSTKLHESSYYNHIKSLILRANVFTMIQTSNYCSLIIDQFIKQSTKAKDKKSLKDKYFVIISNQVARNDLRYRIQSKMNIEQQDIYSKNFVCFNIRDKYKISIFLEYYSNFISELVEKIISSINDFQSSDCDNEDILFLHNLYIEIFIEEIFDYSPIFFKKSEAETKESIYNFFDIKQCDNNESFTKNDKSIESISKICYNFFERFNKYCKDEIEDEEFTVDDLMLFLQNPSEIWNKYDMKDIRKKNKMQPFFENFSELYLFMLDLNSIKSYFYDTNINAVDLKKLNKAKNMFKKEIESFFGNTKQDNNPTNIIEVLLNSAKKDVNIKNIYIKMVDVLYSNNLVNDRNELIKSIMDYVKPDISNNIHFKPLEDKIEKMLYSYEMFIIRYNAYITCSKYNNFFKFNKELLKEVIYLMIYDDISNIFPINRNNIDYILYDKKYYILLSECIYYNHLLSNDKNFQLFTIRLFSAIVKYFHYFPLDNIADLYSNFYLLQMYTYYNIGEVNVFDNGTRQLFNNHKDITQSIFDKLGDKFDDYINDSIIYCLLNDYDIKFYINDIYELSKTERDFLILIISSVIQSLSLVSLPITEVFSIPNVARKTLMKSFTLIKDGKRLYSEYIDHNRNNSSNRRRFLMYLDLHRNATMSMYKDLYNGLKDQVKNGYIAFKEHIKQVYRQNNTQIDRVNYIINIEGYIRRSQIAYNNIDLNIEGYIRRSQITYNHVNLGTNVEHRGRLSFDSTIRLSSGVEVNVVDYNQIRDILNEAENLHNEMRMSYNNTINGQVDNRVGNGVLRNADTSDSNSRNRYDVLYSDYERFSGRTIVSSDSNSHNQYSIMNTTSDIYSSSVGLRSHSNLVEFQPNRDSYINIDRSIQVDSHIESTSFEDNHNNIHISHGDNGGNITITGSNDYSVEINNNDHNIVKKLTKAKIEFVADTLLDAYIYDNFFTIIDKEEYENKLYAIKHAYINQTSNIYGAEWNIKQDYFTLPRCISQNYIMSDLRAMVVGGAHFDNSCFIKGTSAGIFVQNNQTVTKSFIEVMNDYIDIVDEKLLDVKMGRYLVAYYKVINFLYELGNYYQYSPEKLKSLHSGLSSITNFMETNNIIQNKEMNYETKTQKINDKTVENVDHLVIKDFVIQLKRIGESNYKFYETQMPAKKGQASNNNDNSKGGDVQEAQPVQDNSTATATVTATATDANTKSDNSSSTYENKNNVLNDDINLLAENKEMPVLLGSLIYDESWFKSDIDKYN